MEKFLLKYSDVPEDFIYDFFDISKEEYHSHELIIDFDVVVNWLKIRKDNLKRLLVNNFEEKYDYVIEIEKIYHDNGASRKEVITITPNCFKELCMLSQTPKAKEVRKYYISIEKLIFGCNEEIQESLYKKLGLLYKNQKPKLDIKGGVIYIIQALNDNLNLYKIGKTKDLRNRMSTYNSGNANDIEPLFIIKVTDIDAVESCVKQTIKEYQYRKYKEIYEIDLDVLKRIISDCDDFSRAMKNYLVKKRKGQNSLKKLKGGNLFLGIYRD